MHINGDQNQILYILIVHIILQQSSGFVFYIVWQQGLSLSQAYSYPPLLLIYTFCIPSDNENFFLSFKESNNSYLYNCNISIKAGYAMPQIINYKQKREGKMYIHLSKNCTYILPINTLLTIDFCINNAFKTYHPKCQNALLKKKKPAVKQLFYHTSF